MKLGEWKLRQHLLEVMGEEADVFGNDSGFALRVWRPRPGFAIYQRGEEVAIAIDGLGGNYFKPDLQKLTAAGLDAADRIAGGNLYGFGKNYCNLDEIEKLFS